jgi:cytochrome P450
MFSTGGNKTHSLRKRMLSNIYSKSVVTASPALRAQMSTILYDRFLPSLLSSFVQKESGVLNVYALLSATTMDIVTGYIFGLKSGSNLLQDKTKLAWFLDLYNSRRSFNFWPQELPSFTAFVENWFGYRLVPKWVDKANGDIEDWTRHMCESADSVLIGGNVEMADTPVVFQQLSAALSKEAVKVGQGMVDVGNQLASELLDHLAAGFDTSGITLTYVIHELCRNPEMQAQLQKELHTLSPPITTSSASGLPDAKAVDALPLLHAVIWETLRLHPAIPGPQPRVTPPQGCRLGTIDKPYHVPGGVRVSASAGLLHSNEDVYEYASEWRPSRWLNLQEVDEGRRKDMESRWFWAFGRSVDNLHIFSGH